ncbi:MAG: hypothetical protein AABY22_03115 [Nanoarchaeota archaeon]
MFIETNDLNGIFFKIKDVLDLIDDIIYEMNLFHSYDTSSGKGKELEKWISEISGFNGVLAGIEIDW